MPYDAFHDGDEPLPSIPPEVRALCARLMALPPSERAAEDAWWDLEERIIRDHPLTWEVALHLRTLGMVIEPPSVGSLTPWGFVKAARPLGPYAVEVRTGAHGGIWVSPEGVALIPSSDRMPLYDPPGWFEEDDDWLAPYVHLRLWEHADDDRLSKLAQRLLRDREARHPPL